MWNVYVFVMLHTHTKICLQLKINVGEIEWSRINNTCLLYARDFSKRLDFKSNESKMCRSDLSELLLNNIRVFSIRPYELSLPISF